jgi:hypothetical protein
MFVASSVVPRHSIMRHVIDSTARAEPWTEGGPVCKIRNLDKFLRARNYMIDSDLDTPSLYQPEACHTELNITPTRFWQQAKILRSGPCLEDQLRTRLLSECRHRGAPESVNHGR